MKRLGIALSLLLTSSSSSLTAPIAIVDERVALCRVALYEAANEASLKLVGRKWYIDDKDKTIMFMMDDVNCENLDKKSEEIGKKIASWMLYMGYTK